ncbi:hypothetical protein Ami103574_10870 [Aminipila butyrica]|uniref:Uncharacterized protein n=1 Tax=Aminipila butyrica TaxID=433296 RepID=A0A858BUR1_9FIRM|nr:hypothetical protein [Aminipila butyrica]QIB69791.1 hypothetical protein Ami103574_10870 [Aminipila butyrica]
MKTFVNKILAIFTVAILCIGAYGFGVAADESRVYAASQYDNLNQFKGVGDYFVVSDNSSGKQALAAMIPDRLHTCAVSGVYTIEIWTPKGEDGQAVSDNSAQAGTPGQYMIQDVNIVKGSKFTTGGNLAEGAGIKGIIQLSGGNGGSGANKFANGSSGPYDGGTGGTGYYAGVGGKGGYGGGRYQSCGNGGKGGDGYVGGNGGKGGTIGILEGAGGTGGSGFIAGMGGAGSTTASSGSTYPLTYASPMNQDAYGNVKWKTGGAFPGFTVQANNGTVAQIKITLKKVVPDMSINDGIIPIALDQSSSYESQMRAATALEKISSILDSKLGGNTTDLPVQSSVVSVVKGKAFDIYVPVESTKSGNTVVGTVTVINNDVKDGLLQLVGRIDTAGNKEIVVGDTKFVLQTVEEPDSTNVTAILN